VYDFAAADELSVSFQRFPYPATGIVDALPASCGALPVFIEGPGRILVPSPAGEAMWIALLNSPDAAPMAVHFTASTRPDGRVDVLNGHGIAVSASAPATFIEVPPYRFIRGIPRPGGGWWPLARHAERPKAPSCQALELMISAPPIEAAPAKERRSEDAEAGIYRLHIELVDADNFTRVSGEDIPPLRLDSAYGGWRLP
jgi:hypothetical protein